MNQHVKKINNIQSFLCAKEDIWYLSDVSLRAFNVNPSLNACWNFLTGFWILRQDFWAHHGISTSSLTPYIGITIALTQQHYLTVCKQILSRIDMLETI